MRHLRSYWFVLSLAALVAGCALFGVENPDTFNQRLAYGYSAETAVLQQIAAKTNAGQMNSADNERFVAMAENAKDLTDSARDAMRGGDATTAEGKLRLAINILTELDDYVRSRP